MRDVKSQNWLFYGAMQLLGVLSMLFEHTFWGYYLHYPLFGQLQGLTRLFPMSLRSYGGGKGLKMEVMHANSDVFLRLLEMSQVSNFDVITC
jgi:hypothetical protein